MAQDGEQGFQRVSMAIAEESGPICNDVQHGMETEGETEGTRSDCKPSECPLLRRIV